MMRFCIKENICDMKLAELIHKLTIHYYVNQMIIKVDINMTHVIKTGSSREKYMLYIYFFSVSSDLHDADTHCQSLQ